MGAELGRYLPLLVAEWAQHRPDERHQRIEGTLVFTDLSGFTALSEKLAQLGRLGAEELVEHLDSVFSELLTVAAGLGGSLVKFGGDALLIFFWGDDHAARACRAAREMQRTLRQVGRITTTAGSARLRMSVGVHSGGFDFFLVGDSHRELYVTGEAATTTVQMEAAADADEVLLSPATAALLGAGSVGDAKGPGLLLRRAPRASDAMHADLGWPEHLDAEPFVPLSLRRQLAEGGHEPEHRQIVACFLHASSIDRTLATEGPEAAAERLHRLTAVVQHHFAEHGVTFLATDIYNDGPKILAATGAPVSWDNDEERMLRALRAVLDADHGVELRIGVNRGRAFSGEVGPPFRRTYVAMGDVVNTAARVCAKAGADQLLATGPVLERSSTLFHSTELPAFAAKGKALPLVAHEVGAISGVRERITDRALPLVGRDAELDRLQEALDAAAAGSGQAMEISGEPGIGKSRLLDELRARAAEHHVVSVRCERYESTTPFHPFRSLLASIVGERSSAALRTWVSANAPDLEPWLPLLAIPLDVDVAPTPEVDRLDPDFVQGRLHQAVADLVTAGVGRPTVWIVDDAHWADEASAALLRHLVGGPLASLPLLLVAGGRPRAEEGGLLGGGAQDLRLQPLGEEAAVRLVQAAASRPLLPQHAAALAARGEGNPLFLRELGVTGGDGDDMSALPETVEALVAARIDRLPPGDRRLVRHLAVLGAAFDEELATALSADLPVPDWAGPVHDIVERAEGLIRFRDTMVRDVAYEGLSFRKRRQLHRRAGELIEARLPDVDTGLLSLHFHEARDWGRSLHYSEAAAAAAEEKHAYLDAARFWRRAAEDARLADIDDTTVAQLWRSCGEALRRGGDLTGASTAYGKARRLSRDPHVLIELLGDEGTIRHLLGRPDQAVTWFRRAQRMLHQVGVSSAATDRVRARLATKEATLAYTRGRLTACIELCHDGLVAATASGDVAEEARLLSVLHIARGRQRHPDRDSTGARALELAQRSSLRRLQGDILGNLGMDAHLDGRWREAATLYRESIRTKRATGYVIGAATDAANLGEILTNQGHLQAAIPLLEEALSIFSAARYWYAFMVERYLARAESAVGHSDRALELLDDSELGLERLGASDQVSEVRLRRAEALLRDGRWHDAADQLDRMSPDPSSGLEAPRHRLQAHVAVAAGDGESGLQLLEQSLDAAAAAGDLYEQLAARHAMSELMALVGRDPDPHRRMASEFAHRLGVVRVIEPELHVPPADAMPAGGIADAATS